MQQISDSKPSRFERFGLYYLDIFDRYRNRTAAFQLSDNELKKGVDGIQWKGIILSSLIGIICVFPIIWVDLRFSAASFLVHYGWVALVTILATAVEFYLLFYIALKAVHEVSELIQLRHEPQDDLQEGVFGVKNILARTALEIEDPELKLLGIDPFKKISRKNLFVLGLLYKGKIILTNLVLKYLLILTVGNTIFGIPILYEAILVEVFWNSVVIRKVIREARLRLFGYALANRIANNVRKEGYLDRLGAEARKGCLRAIGNAVVMTQNYHPNMVILLLRFQQVLQMTEPDHYDDWNLFLAVLEKVSEQERNFLLDLFTVAASFDGKLSQVESDHFRQAYGDDYPLYKDRLLQLTDHLVEGRLNAALSYCRLDFTKG